MAIERQSILADSTESYGDGTSVPGDGSQQQVLKTQDFKQIHEQYAESAAAPEEFVTGAMLPRDMTVKLVRAESANWETFLSILYSATLTLFGLFLGAGLSKQGLEDEFSTLEWLATWGFLGLSIVLVSAWGFLKFKLQQQGLKVPISVFDSLSVHGKDRNT